MWKMILTLLPFLVSFLESVALEDLEGKAFVFPKASNTAYVVFNTTIKQPLTSLTLCMRFYTDLTREYSLFSFASERSENEILLYRERPNQYGLYLTTEGVIFSVPSEISTNHGRQHMCVSWASSTGLVELWVNGQPLVRKSLKKGHSVTTGASIMIGQEQDTFGGDFDINQSFVGEISDVHMWDCVLSPEDVSQVWYKADTPGNLINWNSLNYNIYGEVFVKPDLASFYRAQSNFKKDY